MNEIVVSLIGGLSLVIVAMIQANRKVGKARWAENKQDHSFVVEKIESLGKSLGLSIDRVEDTALRTEVKLDQHINDHVTGRLSNNKKAV
jgi:hypothetical protein